MRISKKVLANVAEFYGWESLRKTSSVDWRWDDDKEFSFMQDNGLLALLKARLRKKGLTFLTSWSADKKHWEAWIRRHVTQTGKTELAALMLAISAMTEGSKK